MTDKFHIVPVPKEHLDSAWPAASLELAKATNISRGKFSVEDIYTGILNDMYVLWVILENATVVAAFTTRLIKYPNRQAMALDWVGGQRMSEWLPQGIRAIKAHAKANNCAAIEGYGRSAWGRWLAKYGFEPEYIAYKMELD